MTAVVHLELHGVDSSTHGALAHGFKEAYGGPTHEEDSAKDRRLNVDTVAAIFGGIQCLLAIAAIWITARQSKAANASSRPAVLEAKAMQSLLALASPPSEAEVQRILEQLDADGFVGAIGGYEIRITEKRSEYWVIGRRLDSDT